VRVQDFKACLRSPELGLMRKDVNLLMGMVPIAPDGTIDIARAVPACVEALVARCADAAAQGAGAASDEQLRAHVLRCFEDFDVEGAPRVMRRVRL
jgi:hypothetical protein